MFRLMSRRNGWGHGRSSIGVGGYRGLPLWACSLHAYRAVEPYASFCWACCSLRPVSVLFGSRFLAILPFGLICLWPRGRLQRQFPTPCPSCNLPPVFSSQERTVG